MSYVCPSNSPFEQGSKSLQKCANKLVCSTDQSCKKTVPIIKMFEFKNGYNTKASVHKNFDAISAYNAKVLDDVSANRKTVVASVADVGEATPNQYVWQDYEVLAREITTVGTPERYAIVTGKHRGTGHFVMIKAYAGPTEQDPVIGLAYEDLVYDKPNMRNLTKAISHYLPRIAQYAEEMTETVQTPSDAKFTDSFNAYQDIKDILRASLEETFKEALVLGNYSMYCSVYITPNSPYSMDPVLRLNISDTVMRSILFQLLFAVFAMNQSGIQHNYLTPENIMIESVPNSDKAIYVINNKVYLVPTPVKVYIYNFELSVSTMCGPNTYLSTSGLCQNLEKNFTCTHLHPKVDVYRILHFIRNYENSLFTEEAFSNFLTFAIGKPDLSAENKEGTFQTYFEKKGFFGKSTKYLPETEPAYVKLPGELIQHPLFESYYKGELFIPK